MLDENWEPSVPDTATVAFHGLKVTGSTVLVSTYTDFWVKTFGSFYHKPYWRVKAKSVSPVIKDTELLAGLTTFCSIAKNGLIVASPPM